MVQHKQKSAVYIKGLTNIGAESDRRCGVKRARIRDASLSVLKSFADCIVRRTPAAGLSAIGQRSWLTSVQDASDPSAWMPH